MEALYAYAYLAVAILAEVAGTTALKFSDGFSNRPAVVVVVVAYLTSFYCLSVTLEGLPISVVYATWSAVGILAIAAIGVGWFGDSVDLAGLVGMALVVAGVLVLNLVSGMNAA